MRLLLALVALGALLWSGYWYMGATAVERGFERWFEQRRADGWTADVGHIDVAGFPNRIDTSLDDIVLADPETGLGWHAPFLQIFALSYRPNHVIAVWPHHHRITTPQESFEVTSDDMRASLVVDAATELALRRLTLTAKALRITSERTGAHVSFANLTLAAERVESDAAYRLGLRAEHVAPPLMLRPDACGSLPATLPELTADATVIFDVPWDRFAIERTRPQPRRIEIAQARAQWGELDLQVAGDLDVDAAGRPRGTLTVTARNWREMVTIARQAGVLRAGLADAVEDGLGALARLSGDPRTLSVPLDFADGGMFLGPVPIGPAPVLTLP